METTISIDSESCIKCGKCVRVCPSKIFSQAQSDSSVVLSEIQNCIGCGHCVAACPTGSVRHELFPPSKVHPIDYKIMPTPEQVMLLCRARRSNRAFSTKAIPTPVLDMIVEAAHRAPTASNLQQVEFTVVTTPEILNSITDFTLTVFGGIAKKLGNPLIKPIVKRTLPGVYRYLPMFERLIREHASGNDLILRGATAVIFIHTPTENRFGGMDANLAYQNGSLMAESLGISQFYTGFVCNAIKQDTKNSLAKSLGINGTIHAGMALGVPSFHFGNYIDKKDVVVTKL